MTDHGGIYHHEQPRSQARSLLDAHISSELHLLATMASDRRDRDTTTTTTTTSPATPSTPASPQTADRVGSNASPSVPRQEHRARHKLRRHGDALSAIEALNQVRRAPTASSHAHASRQPRTPPSAEAATPYGASLHATGDSSATGISASSGAHARTNGSSSSPDAVRRASELADATVVTNNLSDPLMPASLHQWAVGLPDRSNTHLSTVTGVSRSEDTSPETKPRPSARKGASSPSSSSVPSTVMATSAVARVKTALARSNSVPTGSSLPAAPEPSGDASDSGATAPRGRRRSAADARPASDAAAPASKRGKRAAGLQSKDGARQRLKFLCKQYLEKFGQHPSACVDEFIQWVRATKFKKADTRCSCEGGPNADCECSNCAHCRLERSVQMCCEGKMNWPHRSN
ncbi:uncharacterized protein MONBRDRAFT_39105 [Monosiga brevicollis MX1]|uniref:Uncharacterized protein n=1 Tax=Monosiga brevicollis TaxID=81824 RepID=A9VC83_MONBE|nr:uncharacterized protein MONBRDRAFT_39105 [Monosiga brevicollis MX1]EDQ84854.1 predicted protein [Monosiga brevicollis MX1]|eukprot:XP_001750355.1 hypothetical protein [Monosiga brevicollis MX1]